jgi:hypothetical protein
MESESAIVALGALAQGTRRWTCFVCWSGTSLRAGGGEIARQLDVPQNTMSAHLGILARAGLVRSNGTAARSSTAPTSAGCAPLTLFLVKDCCAATPNCASRSSPVPLLLKSPASRTDSAVDIVIYHNPECGTSRNTLP